MSWTIGAMFLCMLSAVGAVIIYHHNERKPIARYLAFGLAKICLGLILLCLAGVLFTRPRVDQSLRPALRTRAIADRLASLSPSPHLRSAPAQQAQLAQPPPNVEPSPDAGASHQRPTPTSHLYVPFEELQRRLGAGSRASSSAITVTEARSPIRSKQIGTAWAWNEPDYQLTCAFGPDGICYAATYFRNLSFTDDQVVAVIRAEIGNERPIAVPGNSNEVRTLNGVSVRVGQDLRIITVEAPELPQLRAAALAELDAERTRPIQVR